jgi:hypothetical protein
MQQQYFSNENGGDSKSKSSYSIMGEDKSGIVYQNKLMQD